MRLWENLPAKDILFCLFDGRLTGVDIYLKPEAMHFGTGKLGEPAKIPWRPEASSRVIDIECLANQMKAATSADFAFQMIEPVEKVQFKL